MPDIEPMKDIELNALRGAAIYLLPEPAPEVIRRLIARLIEAEAARDSAIAQLSAEARLRGSVEAERERLRELLDEARKWVRAHRYTDYHAGKVSQNIDDALAATNAESQGVQDG